VPTAEFCPFLCGHIVMQTRSRALNSSEGLLALRYITFERGTPHLKRGALFLKVKQGIPVENSPERLGANRENRQ